MGHTNSIFEYYLGRIVSELGRSISLMLLCPAGTLSAFLDQCSSEGFFRCASLFLRNPRLEPPLLEKMLMLLQKLSSIRSVLTLHHAWGSLVQFGLSEQIWVQWLRWKRSSLDCFFLFGRYLPFLNDRH